MVNHAWFVRFFEEARYLPKRPWSLRNKVQGKSMEVDDRIIYSENSSGQTAEFVLYPGAPHAFFADYRPSFRLEAAADAWRRCLAWFNQVPSGTRTTTIIHAGPCSAVRGRARARVMKGR